MMRNKLYYGVVLASAVLWTACNDDDNDSKKSLGTADATFAKQATLSNMTEIKLGELASTKADDPMVKQFGQQMVTEHTKALTDLKTILGDFKAVSDIPTQLDASHQAIQQQLNSMTGYSFDSLYMSTQVTDHNSAKEIFQNESTSGQEQKLKTYAGQVLTNIQSHIGKADSITTVLTQQHSNNDGN